MVMLPDMHAKHHHSFSNMDHTSIPSFSQTLAKHNLSLVRGKTNTLQINIGLNCNQVHREGVPFVNEAVKNFVSRNKDPFAIGRKLDGAEGAAASAQPDLLRLGEAVVEVEQA